ncbi:MAG: DEAD/DEAH box helicase [Treponema sp.]|jgi:ATP-dependent RNA helicase DeaD|nr:DEAD/DEAH box helicase [Treponema sp.]
MSDTTSISPNASFSSFGLTAPMLAALERKGFTVPTPIQSIALPRLLADEGHLIVKARTGTGKTAAFGIPLVERLTTGGHAPRALVLTPTRELALQVAREIASLASRREGTAGVFPRVTAVYGGASIRNQIFDLKRGTEIVVGTPGRVIDLMERKVLDLSVVDWFILDEADEMLDMGFFEDVEKILAQVKGEGGEKTREEKTHGVLTPGVKTPRIALFSATMPEGILKIIRQYIGNAEILEDKAPLDEKPLVDQFYMVLKKEDRLEALRRIIDQAEDFYGLVFCATKLETDELARRLVEGAYPAEAIHGDLSQEARERTLRRFRARQTTILVATDVAARGLDIERLTHVINWDLPNDRDGYLHRIGRTGRAGRRGRAVSLALPGERQKMDHFSRSMEKTLGNGIQWTKVPQVKSVMKAVKARIRLAVLNAASEMIPGQPESISAESSSAENPPVVSPNGLPPESVSPENSSPESIPAESLDVSPVIAQLGRELTERLGAEEAVTVLLSMFYGEQLDSSRYGTITEIPEIPRDRDRTWQREGRDWGKKPVGKIPAGRKPIGQNGSRVYVGLGRGHGANARVVASLLSRAGGVPGRLVDAIDVREYCAFATLPPDAARRACAFSRNTPKDPVIRMASPRERR